MNENQNAFDQDVKKYGVLNVYQAYLMGHTSVSLELKR